LGAGGGAARVRVHGALAGVGPGARLRGPGRAGAGPGEPDRAGRRGQRRPPEDLGMTASPEPATPAVCPNCGRAVGATDNFCEACRTELAPPVVSGDAPVTLTECAFCHGEQITADGYCESCGRKVPSSRNHLDLDLGPVAGVTDKGLRHARNEDAMALATAESASGPAVLAVVCDGVSSSRRPDEASLAAVQAAIRVLLA